MRVIYETRDAKRTMEISPGLDALYLSFYLRVDCWILFWKFYNQIMTIIFERIMFIMIICVKAKKILFGTKLW